MAIVRYRFAQVSLTKQRIRRVAPAVSRQSYWKLPNYRLCSLARYSEKLQEQHYRELFGLNLREGDIIGIVGDYGEASLRHVGQALNVRRSNMSLLVNRLIRRDLLARVTDIPDKRETRVALTPRARVIHKSLREMAVSLNEELLSAISAQQRQTLLSCLDALTDSARSIRRESRRRA